MRIQWIPLLTMVLATACGPRLGVREHVYHDQPLWEATLFASAPKQGPVLAGSGAAPSYGLAALERQVLGREPAGDDRMAINMSVWESLDSLRQFVYQTAHVGPLRDRKQWFEPIDGPILALWWIAAGHIPSVAEALERLEILKVRGPSPEAFTFRQPFPAPGDEQSEVMSLDAAFCEWAT